MARIGRYLLGISLLLCAFGAQAQVSQKPLPGQDLNNVWTGTNTFTQANNTLYVTALGTYTTIPAAVTACLALTNCSVVDATPIGNAVYASGTFTLGNTSTHPIVLKLGYGQMTVTGGPTSAGGVTSMIVVNKGSGIQCVPAQSTSAGAFATSCLIKIDNSTPAQSVIQLAGAGAFLRDVVVDGNAANNATNGPNILVNKANRVEIANVTSQNSPSHGLMLLSSGLNDESCCAAIRTYMGNGNFGSGFYSIGSADVEIGEQAQLEANGQSCTTCVNTTNTTITAANTLTWSTDGSMGGTVNGVAVITMVRINNATLCSITARPTTTTETIGQCWNAAGATVSLGTLTGVAYNEGNGMELNNSATVRAGHMDFGANHMDGILVYGTSTGIGSNNEMLSGPTQFGNNYQHDLEIIGSCIDAQASVCSVGNIVPALEFYGGNSHRNPLNTWDNVKLIDGGYNVIESNSYGTGSGAAQTKAGVEIVETAAARNVASSISGFPSLLNAGTVVSFGTALYVDSTQNGNHLRSGNQIWTKGGGTAQTLSLFDFSGGATPQKFIRVNGGNLNFLNNSFAVNMTLTDAGQLQLPVAGSTYLVFGSSSGFAAFGCNSNCSVGLFGGLQLPATTNLLISNTPPTIAAGGCGGSAAAISAPNGTASFNIFTGTAPTSGGCTITMPAATTDWHCEANHTSAISTTNFIIQQTGALSTTSVTLQLFSDVAAATAPTASDTWRTTCTAN